MLDPLAALACRRALASVPRVVSRLLRLRCLVFSRCWLLDRRPLALNHAFFDGTITFVNNNIRTTPAPDRLSNPRSSASLSRTTCAARLASWADAFHVIVDVSFRKTMFLSQLDSLAVYFESSRTEKLRYSQIEQGMVIRAKHHHVGV